MITLSDEGIYINTEQEDHLLPVARRSIIDVCGAGDTVISMASLAYLSGFGLREVAYWSSFAGTLTCQYPGVVPITSALLKAEDH
jgi:bifunctional ADP-heptose synthase (sugar kinase/adenylyltransferase)